MNKYYIFLGQDIKTDNCYLNLNLRENKYFVDSRREIGFAKTQFTFAETEAIRKQLSNLWIRDEDVIPVGDIDD
ncbi:hypothetical protein ACQW5G_00630 [Fructilactobacillus sp. Tb1]|uniref:hypothetical protein n=1 Tax=Fructilactobacillus sp. Tb1 TaxID=3422304 RepID=UPI003D28DA76